MKKVTRLYTGDDGESHFEEIELPIAEVTKVAKATERFKAKEIYFRSSEGRDDGPWHKAPCRQFYIMIDGWLELETGDGTVRRFEKGDVFIAEDTTGRGHLSRSMNRVAAMIPLV
jgi:hypothetical protein